MRNSFTSIDTIPIIQLWGNLVVPLQGDISDSQAEWLRTELLQRIRTTDVTGLAVDLSGVSVIDSHLCGLLANLAAAAELMGVTAVLCGLSPEVVMTLQAMAIDLEDLEPTLSLEEALERLGVRPERSSEDALETEALDEDPRDWRRTRQTTRSDVP
jgi:rsbT antagonist protein RsbS